MDSRVLQRVSGVLPPHAVAGEGSWLIDSHGKRYLDACGGAAVSCLGHAHPRVLAAVIEQAQKVQYAHNSFFTSAATEELASIMLDGQAVFAKAYFVSGGSEAVETAIKLARQFFVERGELQRSKIIARRQSYHGNTLGALSVGGNLKRREVFAPLLIEAHHVSPCFAYREQQEDESDDAYVSRLALELENTIIALGPESVMAFVAETVVGATAGCVPPLPGYFGRIREICDRYGVLLILDEVMCGLGRTGTLNAFEQEGIAPDIMVNAKGLAAGYQPIGAVLLSQAIDDTIANGSGAFKHGHTYNSHAIACAAALAVQKTIREERLVTQVAQKGQILAALLANRFSGHPHVGDIRGRGLFQAIELVADRSTKQPFDSTLNISARIKAKAMELGLCTYPGSGTIDGVSGDHVLLAPSFLVSNDELSIIVERLGNALDAVVDAL